jgi:hypothetical protein
VTRLAYPAERKDNAVGKFMDREMFSPPIPRSSISYDALENSL